MNQPTPLEDCRANLAQCKQVMKLDEQFLFCCDQLAAIAHSQGESPVGSIVVLERKAIVAFLKRKWKKERNYHLKKEYWAHTENRIAVRFEYEYQNARGQWFRAYGNENWEFDENGLMRKRFASINDLKIEEKDRKFK
jgi:nuclear transport factor 2 (NTF2) superfamily protein